MADSLRRASLAGRLLVAYALTFLVVIGLVGFLVERAARSALLDELESGMTEQAQGLAVLVPPDPGEVPGWVEQVAEEIDARITVMAADGVVEGDSLGEVESMENHASRPEMEEALSGGVGTARRLSATTGFRQLYVAVPAGDAQVIRLSLPESSITDRIGELRLGLLTVVGLAGVLGVVVVAIVGQRLTRPMSRLADAASTVAAGNLDIEPPRSSVEELDRIGRSIGTMATELGTRLDEVEGERHTLEVVLDSLPQGTMLVDATDGILYANRSFAALLGPVPATLGKVTPFRLQEMVRRARQEGPVDIDMEHGRPARIVSVVASPVGDGRVLVIVGDVTEGLRINEVRRDFVTNASHELKTPVAAILASAEALNLALERAPDRAVGFADQIERSARSLARLVADLLDLSRLEGGDADHAPLDLAEVVRVQVQRLTELADKRGVSVTSSIGPVSVMGSGHDLGLAIGNLLDNAVRYTDAGGTVTVTLSRHGGDAVIEVADTGAGIPQRDIDRIFERFYRVDEARSRATGGTGLGLSIVRHVVDAHEGRVDVTSQLGSGSTFRMRIPAV